jgi:hypothetical protein
VSLTTPSLASKKRYKARSAPLCALAAAPAVTDQRVALAGPGSVCVAECVSACFPLCHWPVPAHRDRRGPTRTDVDVVQASFRVNTASLLSIMYILGYTDRDIEALLREPEPVPAPA